jgi:hypothetical protein
MKITCTHEHKVCKKLKWAVITDKENDMSYSADIDLWHCNDCDRDLYKNWHTNEYALEPPSNEKVAK